VLIPTKELVYAPYLEMHDFKIKGYYADLIRFETINRMAIITLLDDLEANYVDVLNEMQKAALEVAEDGKLLYPYSADGHPNERGYQVIAKVIAEIIRQHSDLSDNKLF
jgi:lysophospholipase L1-like esterase